MPNKKKTGDPKYARYKNEGRREKNKARKLAKREKELAKAKARRIPLNQEVGSET